MRRYDILNDLINFAKPLNELKKELKSLGWDSEEVYEVKSTQLKSVLKKYILQKITVEDLEEWANLLECREDLYYEKEKDEIISHIIYHLANPSLEGEINYEKCKKFMSLL